MEETQTKTQTKRVASKILQQFVNILYIYNYVNILYIQYIHKKYVKFTAFTRVHCYEVTTIQENYVKGIIKCNNSMSSYNMTGKVKETD